MPRTRLLPARPAAGLRAAVQGVHPARRRGPADPAGPGGREHRRRAAVHHRPGHPGAAPGHPGRRPRAAAGREHHPPGAPGRHRPLRPPPGRGAQQDLGSAGYRHAARPRRAGRAGRAWTSLGGQVLAARTWAGPGRGCYAVSEHIGRTAAGDGRATVPPGPAVRKARRQRRPTGAPPPLPHPVNLSTTAWLVLVAVGLAGAFLAAQHTPWLRVDDRVSTWVLGWLAGTRTPWLTDVDDGIKVAGTSWRVTVLGGSLVILTAAFRRWRHLLVFLCSLFFLEIVVQWIYRGLTRPRPYGVPIIASWGGYSAPSPPVAALTIFLVGVAYCLAVPGRPRSYVKVAATVAIALFCLARLYLGLDHPADVLLGVALGVAIPVAAFRFFTPNEVFPVVYRRGRTAHVDVTGRRGEAIRQAVHDQLGLTVTEIKPVGLESSAGSTPLRLRVEGGPDEFVFAKLYTKGHVRADRWYKLWRTILYGSLEDESPFKTVRRLVTYEDYALRLLQDIGVRTAKPYGIVEITPEREYMLVTEFHAGAVEIGEAEVDDTVIDQGLLLIRMMWTPGTATGATKRAN